MAWYILSYHKVVSISPHKIQTNFILWFCQHFKYTCNPFVNSKYTSINVFLDFTFFEIFLLKEKGPKSKSHLYIGMFSRPRSLQPSPRTCAPKLHYTFLFFGERPGQKLANTLDSFTTVRKKFLR